MFALPFEGGRFDVGNPLDAMKAQVELAIERAMTSARPSDHGSSTCSASRRPGSSGPID